MAGIEWLSPKPRILPAIRIPYTYTAFCRSSAGGFTPPMAPGEVDAPRLRRAALPVEFFVPPRCVAPRGARPACADAGLCGTRHHRRMLGLGRGAGASRREGSGLSPDHRE